MSNKTLWQMTALCILLFSGCLLAGDLVAGGFLDVERQADGDFLIKQVSARQVGETLVVRGFVVPREAAGWVDIAVLGPERSLLAETRVPVVRNRHRRPQHPPAFDAQLQVVPPKGSLVRITFSRDMRAR